MFDILVSDPNCEDLDLFEVTAQDTLPDDNYSNTTIEWTLNRFNVQPANPCADDIIYSCQAFGGGTDEDRAALCHSFIGIYPDVNAGKLSLRVDTDDFLTDKYPPGTYTFLITATSQDPTQPTQVATLSWNLINPCSPATRFELTQPPAYTYTIGDAALTAALPQIIVEPQYCLQKISFDLLQTSGSLLPIVTNVNEKIDFTV